jgi:hypothetical protein
MTLAAFFEPQRKFPLASNARTERPVVYSAPRDESRDQLFLQHGLEYWRDERWRA